MERLRISWHILRDAARGWIDDDAMSMGAAIAFYTTFSLAPIVVLVTTLAGMVFGEAEARGALTEQLGRLVGEEPARAVEALASNASTSGNGTIAGLLGIATILVGATTVFAQLQTSLNTIWKAAPPEGSPVALLVKVRLRGLALVGAIGFLLVVSLAFSAALAAVSAWLGDMYPDIATILRTVDVLTSWAAFTALFALIYRALPDTPIAWGDIWTGSAATALLFSVGKYLIGLYLGTSGVATAYGAAGSLVLILLWVYYSSVIFLFGAEITRAYSEHLGSRAGRGDRRPDAPPDAGGAVPATGRR
ncbi:YihY/virulence factor BrkB family protein [Arenibaculum pallidiluteum]|uniref:YihY/virulence factor BrkB family protein n=1 Tax=Arenibaculum pallidiluteum TaxID=2812559 RepID=UPI001A96FDD1|nr:YihY/virulence factor BrkB family protein [Arenibaculum pallidiluteum]